MSEEEFYNKLKYHFFGTVDDKGFKELIKAFNDKCKEIKRLKKEVREYIGSERFLYNPNFLNSENIEKILDKVNSNV